MRRTIDGAKRDAGVSDRSRCHAGDCVARTLARLATVLGSVPDRQKTIYLIATDGAGASGSASLGTVHRLAQWSNVTIHALDPSGLIEMSRAGADPNVDETLRAMRVRHGNLRDLAEATGGRAVVNINDPAGVVPTLHAEGQSYYLIGFERTAEHDDGRLHPLQVKVNRPNTVVRARTGYYVQTAEQAAAIATMGTTPKDLRSAVLGLVPNSAVVLSVAAAPFATPDLRKATVTLSVGVRHRLPGEIADEEIRTVAAAFDASGQTRGWRQETMALSLPIDSDGVVRYDVLSRLELEPGRYDVRVALTRSGGGVPGSVFTTIDVPDFATAPLSMSGLVLESSAQPATAAAHVVEGLIDFLPTSLREFRKDDKARVLVRVYQGGAQAPEPVTLSASVVDAANGSKFSHSRLIGADAFADARVAENIVDLPLETLELGHYLLRVEAATVRGERTVRELRFVLR